MRIAFGAAVFCAFLTAGCNNATSTTTPAMPAPKPANVAGQYRGTVTDTAFGSGKALGDFSQTGTTVGGRLKLTYGSETILNSVAMKLAHANSLSGSAVATIGKVACTFAISATYDSTTFDLTGNYSASNGCSGESGTFAMKERCYYSQSRLLHEETATRMTMVERPENGLHGC